MAIAKRCDRCSEFYIVNTIPQKICVKKDEDNSWYRMDLCDTCYKDLLGFFWL